MTGKLQLFLLTICCGILLPVQAQIPAFVENKGQWSGNFQYRLMLPQAGVFLNPNSAMINLYQRQEAEEAHNHTAHGTSNELLFHSYEMEFLGADPKAVAIPQDQLSEYHNYIKGNNPEQWRSKVHLYETLLYQNVYPGIDLKYLFSSEGNLKYEFHIQPQGSHQQIKIDYSGADELELRNGDLIIHTSLGEVRELKPIAWQVIENQKVEIPCAFRLEENTVSFELEGYNATYPLIIDPTLVFSTYTGSSSDNWGYTATYGADGSAYGGGIVFPSSGMYPTTVGAWSDSTLGGDLDIGISKFSHDGTSLIYSTYLGGNSSEMPYSLIEADNGDLLILGNTGSPDFPVTPGSYQDIHAGGPVKDFDGIMLYAGGIDIFLLRLDNSGGSVKAATFMGGTETDGLNDSLYFNYADDFRGEVMLDDEGNVYATATTYSSDFPVAGEPSAYGGNQDGVVFSLDSSLSNLRWSRYIGGPRSDATFSIKYFNNELLLTGASVSTGLFPGSSGKQQTYIGGESDGILLKLNSGTGGVLAFTYTGTSERDVNFFVEYDQQGRIYIFGQTKGDYLIQGADVYVDSNSAQFLQMFSNDLQQSLRSTVYGSGTNNRANISPTALMVDTCGNVYMAGWGGKTNSYERDNVHYQQGFTVNLPVTDNAYRKVSDGSDFHLLVLDASWKKLNYATFFGVNDNGAPSGDHVDGGTSRFARDGTIYQAVCASCSSDPNSFPTTPNAYSTSRGGPNCNLAVFKFAIEFDAVNLNIQFDEDSACIPYFSNVFDYSYNADIIQVHFPDGRIDTLENQITIDSLGTHLYTFVGIDTSCGFTDTTTMEFYGFREEPMADFEAIYDSCSGSFDVQFMSKSTEANKYNWRFGDGNISILQNPVHRYSAEGNYKVTLIATNTECATSDTLIKFIEIREVEGSGEFIYDFDPCLPVPRSKFHTDGKGFQHLIWYVNGEEKGRGEDFIYDFAYPGMYTISLESIDSMCERYYQYDEEIFVSTGIIDLMIPNVFTPNGDGINDEFGAHVTSRIEDLSAYNLRIFNRWGLELYNSTVIDETWDGRFEGEEIPEGVYYYLVHAIDNCGRERELKGFVHLSR